MPFLSQRTPRESPTLATVSSLSDRRATRQVVPGNDGGETGSVRGGGTGRCNGADKGQESFELFSKNTITCKITDCGGRLLSFSSCDLCHQANQPNRLFPCRALRVVLILSSSFLPLFYPPLRAPNPRPIVCDPNSCRERTDLLVFAICSQRGEKLNRGESGPRWGGGRMCRPPGYRHM